MVAVVVELLLVLGLVLVLVVVNVEVVVDVMSVVLRYWGVRKKSPLHLQHVTDL